MQLKDFIGAIVSDAKTKQRFVIKEITEPEISVLSLTPNSMGFYPHYAYCTLNGDPFSKGVLVFDDPTLTMPFQAAYATHCHTENAYWESFGYWLRRD